HIVCCVTGFVVCTAIAAILSNKFLLIAESDERIAGGHGNQHDIASVSAVTPIGATCGDELLAVKVAHAVATFAAFYVDLCFIKKHAAECNLVRGGGQLGLSIFSWRTP